MARLFCSPNAEVPPTPPDGGSRLADVLGRPYRKGVIVRWTTAALEGGVQGRGEATKSAVRRTGGSRRRQRRRADLGVLGLLWAQVIVLPNLSSCRLRPSPSCSAGSRQLRHRAVRRHALQGDELPAGSLRRGSASFVCVLAASAGASTSSIVAAAVCAAVLALSLVPVAQATRTASAEDVSLSALAIRLRPLPGAGTLRGPFS